MTMLAIGFGVVALLLAGGFIEWVFWAMRESTIQGRLGHIQVSRPGYHTEGVADPFAYLLPEASADLEKLSAMPQVKLLAPRINFSGLISRGDVTLSFIADAGEPEKEAELSVDFRIKQGSGLAEEDPSGIIIGSGLAAALAVKAGDQVTLMTNTSSGGLNAMDATIRGVFYTSNKVWNDAALRVPITSARNLLRVKGAHAWVLLLDDTDTTDSVMEYLRGWLAEGGDRYEIKAWYEMADFYNKTVKLFSRQMLFIQMIIALIVVLGITNTMMMNVVERTGEIGTMQAIGNRRRTIVGLFMAEGLIIGLIAGGVGLLLGISLAKLISVVGIPMPPAPGMDEGYSAEILILPELAIRVFSIAAVTAFVASVYPAWKASRLEIVNALRHNI
jgi:putative ABC transport system permease protein